MSVRTDGDRGRGHCLLTSLGLLLTLPVSLPILLLLAHPVDPSRGSRDDDYRKGYRDGRNRAREHMLGGGSGGSGGGGCAVLVLAVGALAAVGGAAGWITGGVL